MILTSAFYLIEGYLDVTSLILRQYWSGGGGEEKEGFLKERGERARSYSKVSQ